MKIVERIQAACRVIQELFQDPEKSSYYPDLPHKSKLRIWLENLFWLLRYREINHYYFLYGKDCIGMPFIEQVPKKAFCCFRDWVNAYSPIGNYRIEYNALLQDKLLFSQYTKGLGIASPAVLGLSTSSTIHWLDTHQIESFDDLVQHEGLDVFFKDAVGVQGQGIYHVKVLDGNLIVNKQQMSIDDFRKCMNRRYVIQERIIQHEAMNQIYPWSVNTLRVLSVWDEGQIKVMAAMLRLGVGKRVFDNLSAGGICVNVNRDTGCLCKNGFFKPDFGKIVLAHPETGFQFDGVKVPYWDEINQLVCTAHRNFYATHSIGWDVAITENGPTLLEGNNSWEIPMLQLQEPDLLKRYLGTLKSSPILKKAPSSIKKYI